jgi:hypothetical protein
MPTHGGAVDSDEIECTQARIPSTSSRKPRLGTEAVAEELIVRLAIESLCSPRITPEI